MAWKWLFITVPLVLVSFIMTYAGFFSTTFELLNNFLNGLIGLCLFSLICILLAIHRSYDKWVFNSELGHVDLIELLNNHPNKASYTKFMA